MHKRKKLHQIVEVFGEILLQSQRLHPSKPLLSWSPYMKVERFFRKSGTSHGVGETEVNPSYIIKFQYLLFIICPSQLKCALDN